MHFTGEKKVTPLKLFHFLHSCEQLRDIQWLESVDFMKYIRVTFTIHVTNSVICIFIQSHAVMDASTVSSVCLTSVSSAKTQSTTTRQYDFTSQATSAESSPLQRHINIVRRIFVILHALGLHPSCVLGCHVSELIPHVFSPQHEGYTVESWAFFNTFVRATYHWKPGFTRLSVTLMKRQVNDAGIVTLASKWLRL